MDGWTLQYFFLKQYYPALFHYETTNTIAKINVGSLHSCKPQIFKCRNFKKLQLKFSLSTVSVLCCLVRHKNHMVRHHQKPIMFWLKIPGSVASNSWQMSDVSSKNILWFHTYECWNVSSLAQVFHHRLRHGSQLM